ESSIMAKRKVCVVVTARPSYSRIKTALKAIAAHRQLELQLVVAASALLDRYGSAVDVIAADGFEIADRVHTVLEGDSPQHMAKTAGLGMIELSTTFERLKPDVVVSIADRYETMATAVAASYMNVPLAHVQGGEVTGSIDEKVRHAVTKLSDLHLVATKVARERVIRMGEEPKAVHHTGCPSIDLAAEVLAEPRLTFDPVAKYGGVGADLNLSDGGYVVVMQHPVTTEHAAARKHVTETLQAVADLGLPTLWFWPNVDAGSDGTSKGIRSFRELKRPGNIRFFKNMQPTDFLRLLANSRCIIGNSSVAIRECAFLGVPAVNIGSRQQGRERGRNVVDVGYKRKEIAEAARRLIAAERPAPDPVYGDGRAGERIADVLASAELTVEKRLTY
ncbi:MAG TPA: UDP-N-acetylglucosamine 2-epimerase, partial [Humisphaera sp.]